MSQFAVRILIDTNGQQILRRSAGLITPPLNDIAAPQNLVLEPIVAPAVVSSETQIADLLSHKKAKINYDESTKDFLKKHSSIVSVFIGIPKTYTRFTTKKDVTKFVKSKIIESKNNEIKGIQIKYEISKGLVNLRELYTENNVTDIKTLLAAVQLEFEMKER